MHAALVLDLLHQHLRLVRRAGDAAVAVGAVGGADRHTEGGAPEGGFLIEIVGAGIDDDGGEATAMHRVTPELSVDSVGVAAIFRVQQSLKRGEVGVGVVLLLAVILEGSTGDVVADPAQRPAGDRKSTRLNSSH